MAPAGKAMFQMMGVFAEFERSMIQERVRAGLRRAKEEAARAARDRSRQGSLHPGRPKGSQGDRRRRPQDSGAV
jgi:DNA invertase Pin-like site-specific DNA recombinase